MMVVVIQITRIGSISPTELRCEETSQLTDDAHKVRDACMNPSATEIGLLIKRTGRTVLEHHLQKIWRRTIYYYVLAVAICEHPQTIK